MTGAVEARVLKGVAPEYVERILSEAAHIPSPAYPPGNEQAVAEYFAHELKAIGCTVELQEVGASRPNVIARLKGSRPGKRILLNGHMDTTPVVRGWNRDPYGSEREGDLLFGHGVSNMKASCAAMVGAVAALANSDVNFAGEIIVSLVVGECAGGTGTKAMVERGMKADYFINGEPTDLNVLTLHSGVCRVRIHLTGRTWHYSLPGHGVHAIEKMMKVLHELGPSNQPINWVRKPSDKPEYDGLPRYNIGIIRGGLTREFLDWAAFNAPDYCVATLDIRHTPGVTADMVKLDLEAKLSEMAKLDPDIDVEVEPMLEWSMTPFEANIGDYIVDTMTSVAQSVNNRRPDVGALAPIKFMGADSGCLQSAGIPGVMFGVGTFVSSSVPDEFIEVSKLIDVTKMYALTCYRGGAAELASP